jgi:hypothetical protein
MIVSDQRREFLGSLGVMLAGLAGCTRQTDEEEELPGLPAEGTGSTGGSKEIESEPESPPAWDETIPTYPYPETGVGPLEPEPDPAVDNPVLTAEDVTDLDEPLFVADPFLFVEDGEWHMFLEAVEAGVGGLISHATSPDGGVSWEYNQVVLETDWHLSFPYVFKWDGEYYMTTEEGRDDAVVPLYRAEEFPTEWTDVGPAYDPAEFGHGVTDHVFFRWEDRWWSIAGDANEDAYAYYSDDLDGDWTAHDINPVIEGRPDASRPGGRPIVTEEGIMMFYQATAEFYGESLSAYQITDLTPETFEQERDPTSPLLEGTAEEENEDPAWNSLRMHHYDPWYRGEGDGWRAAVDGDARGMDGPNWAIGIYWIPNE